MISDSKFWQARWEETWGQNANSNKDAIPHKQETLKATVSRKVHQDSRHCNSELTL